MPGHGEQHHNATNPFGEVKPHISEYTAAEIATLSSRLEKQLGPEYISSRQGPGGGKVFYLAADKCINLANSVFGFNGWSSSIQHIQVDFVDDVSGRISLGLSVTLRVTLRDGTYHEDIGYGHIENCKGKAAAFEKAKKEGTTDALKRALRNFGNMLGNCIYDKDYLAKVTKIKAGPTKWDPENLHRHADFAPVKQEQVKPESEGAAYLPRRHDGSSDVAATTSSIVGVEDEFGSDDFDAADFSAPNLDHPDEVTIDRPLPPNQQSTISPSKITRYPRVDRSEASSIKAPVPQTPNSVISKALPPNPPTHPLPPPKDTSTSLAKPLSEQNGDGNLPESSLHGFKPELEPAVGFYTARMATSVQEGPGAAAIKASAAFNPRLDSPSIRKTPGIDHSKTLPVNRDALGGGGAGQHPAIEATSSTVTGNPNVQRPSNNNFVNPHIDNSRRIGMPGGVGASPLQNRGSYKPPTMMKRPLEHAALNDVTAQRVNAPNGGAVAGAGDVKRQKIGSPTT